MHNSRHTKPVGLSERVISSTQRPLLTQHTTNTSDTHPCPQRDSNPRTELSRAAADLHGQRDQPQLITVEQIAA